MKKMLGSVLVAAALAGCSRAGGPPDKSLPVADAWVAKWCTVEPGATKEQLVATMGSPTSDAGTSMSWIADRARYYAFLDPDGTVKQLDINVASLTDAEKAALKCSAVRTRRSVAAAKAPARSPLPRARACALVSAAEMSAILGASVVQDGAHGSSGKCIYTAASGVSPYAEVSVDWGDGKIAMSATGRFEKIEPGATNPYAGIGDQAVAVGPALMIRTGEDLLTIVLSGVDNVPGKAKRIFETAKARM